VPGRWCYDWRYELLRNVPASTIAAPSSKKNGSQLRRKPPTPTWRPFTNISVARRAMCQSLQTVCHTVSQSATQGRVCAETMQDSAAWSAGPARHASLVPPIPAALVGKLVEEVCHEAVAIVTVEVVHVTFVLMRCQC
jgi:hypothetical protein